MVRREHLRLIKNTADAKLWRERIRQEREDERRRGIKIIDESKRLLEEADKIMAGFVRITPK